MHFRQFVESLRGEYWITDSGDLMYADGDVSEYNHEGHVLQMLQSQIVDQYPGGQKFNRYEYVDWDAFLNELQQKYGDDYERQIIQELNITPEEWSIACGSGDSRAFAMKNWAWKRVAGDNVETWTLTPKDMKIIARGLGETLEQEGESEEEDANRTFHITVYSQGNRSFEMSLAQLEAGTTATINNMIAPINTQQQAANNYIKDQEKNSFYKRLGDWNLN